MAAKVKARKPIKSLNGHRNGHGPSPLQKALKDLRSAGGLVVRSSVALSDHDAGEQLTYLGKQIQQLADEALAAVARR